MFGGQRRLGSFLTGNMSSLHDFVVKDAFDADVRLGEVLKDKKAVVVVNVASACGLTSSQYKGLVEVYQKYSSKGLEVVAFPCNDFGGQEPGSAQEVCSFAERKGAKWLTMGKVSCEKGEVAPVYKFLKENGGPGELWGWLGRSIKWNFCKFLIDKDGNVVGRFAPWASPQSMVQDIEKLLA